jgi:hypothetical protein
MALVGGGDLQVHQDNNDHNDGNADAGNTDRDGDATSMTVAAEQWVALEPPILISRSNKTRFQNFSAPKARIQFQPLTSSGDWRI